MTYGSVASLMTMNSLHRSFQLCLHSVGIMTIGLQHIYNARGDENQEKIHG